MRGRDCNVEKRREIRNIRENRAISVQASQQSVFLPKIRSGAKLEPRTFFSNCKESRELRVIACDERSEILLKTKKKKKMRDKERKEESPSVSTTIKFRASRFAIARPVCGRLKFRVESGSRSRQL